MGTAVTTVRGIDERRLTADILVAELREAVTSAFAAAIPQGPVSLVDYPDHSNVGDSAIWLGEMAWLDDAGRTPVYSAALNNFSAADLAKAAAEGPILIHGGGNFGTTWPRHEAFRLDLLRLFPGRPIVQLPQSIHYEDQHQTAAMAEAISRHGAFTLLVRDARSHNFARRHFDCDVRLCPDSALYLGRFRRSAPKADVLALLRTDHESVADGTATPADIAETDWLHERRGERRIMQLRIKAKMLLTAGDRSTALRRYRMLAGWRLRRGLTALSLGRVVVTDRLHAHILSLLLDIPHVVLDNFYGKIGDFAAQWTHRYRGFHRVASRAEAFELARRLAASA
jgi:pyruvyl transferase EpsO